METRIINTENELIATLRNRPFDSKSTVSIDGVDGVGKTTLSAKIAQELCISNIELDDFVQKKQGGYVSHIDYDRLLKKINTDKPVVVEGICVLQILHRIQIRPNVSIYIKVVDKYRFCNGQIKYFPPDKSANEVINERKSKGFSVGYEEDLIRYHYSFKPHEKSDLIFERST